MVKGMFFSKTCSICTKKVKQSELKEIETNSGKRIKCCENCAIRFLVKKKKNWS
jgi:hypothetical protein